MPSAGVDGRGVDFVYVSSRGAYRVFAGNRFEALVGSAREIWIGSDGSGMIKEARGPVNFFTQEQRARWEADDRRYMPGEGVDVFGPGGLSGSRAQLAKLPSDPDALASVLTERGPLTLRHVRGLLGEVLVSREFCSALYTVAKQLPDVRVLDRVSDQLGRTGHGLARVEHGERIELIFDDQTREMLAYQEFMADRIQDYAPVGALVGWCGYTSRQLVDSLPEGMPPLPTHPFSP
jgi:hypothetical protein